MSTVKVSLLNHVCSDRCFTIKTRNYQKSLKYWRRILPSGWRRKGRFHWTDLWKTGWYGLDIRVGFDDLDGYDVEKLKDICRKKHHPGRQDAIWQCQVVEPFGTFALCCRLCLYYRFCLAWSPLERRRPFKEYRSLPSGNSCNSTVLECSWHLFCWKQGKKNKESQVHQKIWFDHFLSEGKISDLSSI